MKLAGSGLTPFANCKDTKGTVMMEGDPTALVPTCSTEEKASGCICYTLKQDPRLCYREKSRTRNSQQRVSYMRDKAHQLQKTEKADNCGTMETKTRHTRIKEGAPRRWAVGGALVPSTAVLQGTHRSRTAN